MGACTFINIESGPTMREAFDKAASRARFEHGHSYSGSIGEKTSVELARALETPRDEAMRLADELLDSERFSDKWGPAGAIRLEGDQWLFFGWASE